ncbi:MAG: 4-hydroxy-3-methylbut-2-enyl diphosphate reductase [Spirochaetae bacterium HGW-Spirochaetae-1]|jgi:4-hydroxy-3-methylbut-2-enyl diphosphate reductase|nr:MAG: 4-hydroxy-3-methylbut-2-enyl diphosphate reductase [Spirochaetae bacterium HGW-Spirochaetae-1]
MKIQLAQHSGFCFGVRNAILRIVNELNNNDETIFVYGPLIHNPQTVNILHRRGLQTIHDLSGIKGKQVAVRTHGIPIEDNRYLKSEATRCINLTCPRVANVQSLIKKYSRQGHYTIILGDSDHAEVIGLKSYASAGVTIIASATEAAEIPPAEKYLLVSQTTFDRDLFEKIIPILQKSLKNLTVMDTICDSTRHRQDDVRKAIEEKFDTLIVVGGKNSANTSRLAGIGRENGLLTFHVETEKELQWKDFTDSKSVLVTAGASTPGWIINNVLEKLYDIKFRNSNFFIKHIKNVIELITRTNIISSLFAFMLTLFIQSAITAKHGLTYPVVSMLYIFSMYSFNNYFDRAFLRESNSYKYGIYKKYGKALIFFSLVSIPMSFYLMRSSGLDQIILLLFSYIFGFSYFTSPVKRIMNSLSFPLARKVYNSKIITGLGWLIVTTLLPLINTHVPWTSILFISLFTITMITVRHILIDIIAFQGDFIMGRDTIPIWLGIDAAKYITHTLTALTSLMCIIHVVLEGQFLFLLMILPLLYYSVLINRLVKIRYLITLRYEFIIDANFFLSIAIFLATIIIS